MTSYRSAFLAGGSTIGEGTRSFDDISELEIQARWLTGELGNEWTDSKGRHIVIEDFGRWNREPGPDFVDARVRIDGKLLRGPVEIDLDPRDWERHGHATNPDFRDTILHVFLRQPSQECFTRTCDHRDVFQLHLPSRAPSATKPPAFLITEDPELAGSILRAAAKHRLETKAAAIERQVAWRGEDETWFEAIAAALGYKHNALNLRLLAQRTGLELAASPAGEAALLGLAGFLEAPEPVVADAEARKHLRSLWQAWWKRRAAHARLILPANVWKFGGNRPINHPHRRVAALAVVAASWSPVRDALATGSRREFLHRLAALDHPFWSMRYNLNGAKMPRPQALIGTQRRQDILLNVFHPVAFSRGFHHEAAWLREPGPAPGSALREIAERLFGRAADSPKFLASAAHQQGLLQIDRDLREAADVRAVVKALRDLG